MFKLITYLYRKRIIKYAFDTQKPKPRDFSKMNFAFMDSKGNKYFENEDWFNYTLARKEQLMIKVGEMGARINQEEFRKWRDAMTKALNNGENPDYAMLGFFLKEMDIREKELVIYSPAYIEIAAIFYIRQDEDIDKFDEEVQRQKVAQLQYDFETVKGFFFTPELNKLLGFSEISNQELIQYYNQSKKRVESHRQFLTSHS